MLVELFCASPEDEEQGIWKRPGFNLPQLGALLVASNDEKLIDERTQTELLANSAEYKEFLNEYAELPHEGIGLIIANAFMAEHAERARWEDQQPWKAAGGTYGQESRLGKVRTLTLTLALTLALTLTLTLTLTLILTLSSAHPHPHPHALARCSAGA